mmetsp:Transcript_11203/g.19137  ORF Transcript_11203/g.19137 Transcript_11203/m.19137 type:complete len:360 (+) Transcript_11203:128-1207(+)
MIQLRQFACLERSSIQIIRTNNVQSTFRNQLSGLFDLVALQSNHQRHSHGNDLGRVDDTLSNHVTSHNTTKNIDQNRFDLWVLIQDLKRFRDLLLGRTATHVQKVGRTASMQLNNIHGRHSETSSIDQAANVAIQPNIVQIGLRSTHFSRIFLSGIALCENFRLSKLCIIVKVDLSVDRNDISVGRLDKGVYLHQRRVLFQKQLVQQFHFMHCLFDHALFAETQRFGYIQRSLLHHALFNRHGKLGNCIGIIPGNIFNRSSTTARGNNHGALSFAIIQNRQVHLPSHVHALRDQHFGARPALCTRLFGDQSLTQHSARDISRVLSGIAHMHTRFEPVCESAQSASSGKHLCLDHNIGSR